MPSISEYQALRLAYEAGDERRLARTLADCGLPSQRALTEAALASLRQGDRNQRVLMLRLLRYQHGSLASSGVLAGLHDPKRRVCAAAVQACPNYLAYPDIVERLEAIALDQGAKRKLRRRALSMLAGDEGRLRGDISEPVMAALRRMMASEEHRFTIVFGLARLALEARIRQLLADFAASEARLERDFAGRALAGEIVIHIDAYSRVPALRRRVMESCPIAHGRMYYWLPRDGIRA